MPAPLSLDTFQNCSIPLEEWNHRAHLTIAWLYLRAHPLDAATDLMRRGVQAYNARHGIEQTPTGGYHDTLTIAWMRILHATMTVYGPEDSPDAFLAAHPHLQSKVLLRLFYSRPRIMSHEARHRWVEPDLAPLPTPPTPRPT